jgi:hypothetical protein
MSLVKQALIDEFLELAKKATEYRNTMLTAKTYAKREIYKKKLKENNIKASEVLDALQTLMKNGADGEQHAILSDKRPTQATDSGTQTLELGNSTGNH